MRVTLISKACIVGAYQTKLEAIATHDDIELTVVVPPYWQEHRHKLILEKSHTAGYNLYVIPLAFNGHYHLHYYPTLSHVLRLSAPDVCHIDEEPYNLATWLAVRAGRRAGAKTVLFTWQNLLRRYPPPFALFERYVYRHTDAMIAGNHEALCVLRAKGYEGPIEVIPQFGVDPHLFCPSRNQRDRVFTIGYAGRLVPEKGLLTLFEALRRLEGEWRWLVCGRGPLKRTLQERLASAGLAERAQFHDWVPAEEMPSYLNRMHVLVLPSRTRPNWKEQFGRVLVEAMACEIPVIGSDSGEIPNVIGPAGLIFPEGDAKALAEHLAALRDDLLRRRELGRLGRERVLAHYTQQRIAAETVALYRRVYEGTARGAKGSA